MKNPNFNSENQDELTFSPLELYDDRETEMGQFRLSFSNWEWLHERYGEAINDFYLNGYNIEGLVMAARVKANLDPEADGIEYDSEADACNVYFENLGDASETAQLLLDALSTRENLVAMIEVACENGFDD